MINELKSKIRVEVHKFIFVINTVDGQMHKWKYYVIHNGLRTGAYPGIGQGGGHFSKFSTRVAKMSISIS